MDERCFINEFEDIDTSNFSVSSSTTSSISAALSDALVYLANPSSYAALLGVAERAVDPPDDGSVYTGRAGLALLFLKLGQLDRAGELAREALGAVSSSKVTFLTGFPGPLAILAVVEARRGRTVSLSPILALGPQVCSLPSALPDELLYGRAGYLYTLLYLRAELGPESVPSQLVRQVVDTVLQSGRELAREVGSRAPLMWAWHDKVYYGAAHGLAGVLEMLLAAREHVTPSELQEQVRPTVDYLVNCQFPSGNFPSSKGNDKDRLVHWCHGAPGLVSVLLLAHQVWGGEPYLTCALRAGSLVWGRGLLRKGNGLCHGTAGNGYTFLHLYRATGDRLWLYRACCLATWCSNLGRPELRRPDRPLSLFEGLAGTAYFLQDMLAPQDASFPALQL